MGALFAGSVSAGNLFSLFCGGGIERCFEQRFSSLRVGSEEVN